MDYFGVSNRSALEYIIANEDKKVKIFPVELKDDALNLYKNFLSKTIK